MKILFIAGESVFLNYSTTYFKRTIIEALNYEGHEVTVLQKSKDQQEHIIEYKIINGVNYIELEDVSPLRFELRKIKKVLRKIVGKRTLNVFIKLDPIDSILSGPISQKIHKDINMYGYKHLIKNSKKCKYSDYDLVLSVSQPAISHKIALELRKAKILENHKWIQCWLEYWYDSPKIPTCSDNLKVEERKLMEACDFINYSNQLMSDRYIAEYPDLAYKISYFDMPYPVVTKKVKSVNSTFSIGYFGTYHTLVRNIHPLYEVISSSKYNAVIVGESNLDLQDNERIQIIKEKVPPDECKLMESTVDLLIVLCNWHNDLVPGKLYMYAMTDKPILVILDGPQNGKSFIKSYFGKYGRLYFCDNVESEIKEALMLIQNEYRTREYKIVEDFLPENVISSIFKGLA